MSQSEIKNEALKNHTFLKYMYRDPYFPDFLVDKGKVILIELCLQIERENPTSPEAVCKLTHAATEKFNRLNDEFYDHESEIETVARESIAGDFEFLANSLGFEIEIDELIEPREW